MELTIVDILADISSIDARGDKVRGIEMGKAAWSSVYDSLSGTQKADTKAGCLAGYDFRVVESLGEGVNYLLETHKHDPAWVSREELNKQEQPVMASEEETLIGRAFVTRECKNCRREVVYEIVVKELE